MNCLECSQALSGRQTKFCSRNCKDRFAVRTHIPATKKDYSGSNSPTWKGGHKRWSPGRHGKDKDGLSWKTQRQLAWERDRYICQHCFTKKSKNPDVHHIRPWMNSLSHALDNLICLCQSCHLREEAKVHEVWGGQLIVREPKPPKPPKQPRIKREKLPKRPKCKICGCLTSNQLELGCKKCLTPWVLEQRKTRTIRDIAAELGVSNPALIYWCRELPIP